MWCRGSKADFFSRYRATCPIIDSESQRSSKSFCKKNISNEHNKIKTLSLDVGRRKADVE